MGKDFNAWNTEKKYLNTKLQGKYGHPGEIWWCSLGINIGVETNGKHNLFERPVIILKAYNTNSLLMLPLTSKEKRDAFHYRVSSEIGISYAKLTQVRVISTKRLLRKVGKITTTEFENLITCFKNSI